MEVWKRKVGPPTRYRTPVQLDTARKNPNCPDKTQHPSEQPRPWRLPVAVRLTTQEHRRRGMDEALGPCECGGHEKVGRRLSLPIHGWWTFCASPCVKGRCETFERLPTGRPCCNRPPNRIQSRHPKNRVRQSSRSDQPRPCDLSNRTSQSPSIDAVIATTRTAGPI